MRTRARINGDSGTLREHGADVSSPEPEILGRGISSDLSEKAGRTSGLTTVLGKTNPQRGLGFEIPKGAVDMRDDPDRPTPCLRTQLTNSDPFVVVVLSLSFIASIFFLHIAAKIVRVFTK